MRVPSLEGMSYKTLYRGDVQVKMPYFHHKFGISLSTQHQIVNYFGSNCLKTNFDREDRLGDLIFYCVVKHLKRLSF